MRIHGGRRLKAWCLNGQGQKKGGFPFITIDWSFLYVSLQRLTAIAYVRSPRPRVIKGREILATAHKTGAKRTDLGLGEYALEVAFQAALREGLSGEVGRCAQAKREKESGAVLKIKQRQAQKRERSPTERSHANRVRRRVRGLP